ncbi:hypothetical protein [Streptomyces sp. NPDC093261]|uniref:hypothetical protein n=1 Tax=Streptomyces sp. NPDC093261 TaxID=3366037 RepID=UPI0038237BB3
MALLMEPLTVGTSAVSPANMFVTSTMTYLLVANNAAAGGATVYLGTDSGVSPTTGYPVLAGQTVTIPMPTGMSGQLYLVATAADTPVAVALTF